jgi:hypothetical protein
MVKIRRTIIERWIFAEFSFCDLCGKENLCKHEELR